MRIDDEAVDLARPMTRRSSRNDFVAALAAIGERSAQQRELLLERADADAEDQPSAGDRVERAVALGDLERVVVAEHEHVRLEADERRAGREVAERRQRVVVARTAPSGDLARGHGDVLAAREVVVAEPVGRFRDLDDRVERRGLLPRVVHAG